MMLSSMFFFENAVHFDNHGLDQVSFVEVQEFDEEYLKKIFAHETDLIPLLFIWR